MLAHREPLIDCCEEWCVQNACPSWEKSWKTVTTVHKSMSDGPSNLNPLNPSHSADVLAGLSRKPELLGVGRTVLRAMRGQR